jgi:hypothetical protein
LSQLGVPYTQNFEIPLKAQESIFLKISLENFQKMLDGSKFGQKCLLGISIHNFCQIWKILNLENLEFFLKKGQKIFYVHLGTI